MRFLACLLLGGALALGGCSHKHAGRAAAPGYTGNTGQKLIVTPDTALVGKVVSVRKPDGYAVLNFPIGHLPTVNQRLNVYRLGLKVGELKVTSWQLDDYVIGDIVTGDVNPGDEVRDR